MKGALSYVVLVVGLTLISLPLYAQGLFPGLEVRDMKNWFITFAVGVVFTILWYVLRRYIDTVDKKMVTFESKHELLMNNIDRLSTSVTALTLETRLHRQEANGYVIDINILKKRTNKLFDWAHKHDNVHAKCPNCPETDNALKEPEI